MVRFRKKYNEARYEQLLNSLKQPNAYTHAALYPKGRPPKSTGRNARLITLPEGHLLLARRPHRHAPELKDLRSDTLELDFFILTYDHARQRVRLQISKKMIRQKLAYVNEICSSQYWQRHQNGSGPEKTVQQVIGTVNAVTRELWAIDRHAFVYPDTRRSWDKRVRKSVTVWLISTAKFRKNDATDHVRRYLSTWYVWKNRRQPWKHNRRNRPVLRQPATRADSRQP